MTSTPESSSVPSQGDLFSLLDGDNKHTVEETKALIHENLHSSRDPGLLNSMVEFYLKTRSQACLQILSGIHEARAQALFEIMNECLKQKHTRLDTLTLLGHIVRKQPSWLYKIIKTPFFETLLKVMKADNDVVVLTSGILTITTLLPLVPASIGHCLQDLFDIFTRLSSFRAHRQGNAPEVYLLYLHVAVYMFFHRLYAMYPNNFLAYLRALCNEPSKRNIFQNTIKPMLEHVRLHPCVITETAHTETEKHRWRQKEPHDIVIECMKVSLDPIDRIQEKGTFLLSSSSRHSLQELLADKSSSSNFTASSESQGQETARLRERRMSDSATQTGKSLQSGDSGIDSCNTPVILSDKIMMGWSPSEVCRLSTPPSSQMSPSTSNPDLWSSVNIHSHFSTPGATVTPEQSPTSSMSGDIGHQHGCSCSPSMFGSKVRGGVSAGMSSGRGTPVRGAKTSCHEGQLTKALSSALAQHSHESAAEVHDEHQTSTPKDVAKRGEGKRIETSVEEVPHGTFTISFSQSVSSMFEGHNKEIKDHHEIPNAEHLDSSKISPKEEYRDLSEQEVFALELSEHKALESHQGNITTDCLPESFTPVLTPVAGQSLDTVTLKNSPHVKDASLSMEPEESQHSAQQSGFDSDGLLHNKHHQDCEASTKGHEGLEANKSETSLASDEISLDSSKFHSTVPHDATQNHHQSLAELITSFPQLMFRGEPECATDSCMTDADDAGFSRPQQHLLSSTPSPVEILDSYLKTGSSLHYAELSRVPLVSHANTAWTHYGGEPPIDEVEIMRGQVKLLHNQLLFERHKCDLHAIRNRRLIGKTFKAVQHQEELLATKDQLRLQEDKMRELTDALNKQVEENRRFKSIASSWESHQRTELRNLLNENAQLKYKEKELLEKLEAQQKGFDTKQTEIHQLRAKIFTLENELDRLKVQVLEKEQLSKQVNQLVMELLIMGELNQQQKDTIQKLTLAEGQNPESSMHLHGCHRELGVAKQTLKKQKAELDALTSKLAEMETQISNKDFEIREMKKFTEGLKGTYAGKMQSLEEKYAAQRKITQALESYILDLQAVDSARREKIERETMQPDS